MRRAFLHGFLGDPSVWDGIARDGDLVIALPGHGAPVRATWDENIAAIAAVLRGLAGDTGVDVVIGYSLGARVALGLLANGAVQRAVLISVNPGIADHAVDSRIADHAVDSRIADHSVDRGIADRAVDERSARRASDAAWAARFRTEPLAEVLDAWEAQPLFATQARVAPERLAARRARRLALDPSQLAASLEAMGLAEMPDYREVIAVRNSIAGRAADRAIADRSSIAGDPCTLIVGADDPKYVAIARSLPAPLHVIADAGHDPLLEQPAALAKMLASVA